MNIEKNKQIVRNLIDAMDRGSVTDMLSFFHEDASWIIPGSSSLSGQFTKDMFAMGSKNLFSSFPDGLHFEIIAFAAEGDRVAAEVISNGAHVSNKPYRNHYHFLFILRDDKIVKAMEFMDTKHAAEILYGA